MTVKILCFAGSLRKDSFNKKLVKIAAAKAEAAGATVTYVDLKDYSMPIYDGDIEASEGIPQNAKKLKTLMKEHQGFIFSCPEYNSSITPVLKNTIDWASRPLEGERNLECFKGKVVGLFATSPGKLGGMRGLVTVRAILESIGVICIPDQLSIPMAQEAFDSDGNLKDAKQLAEVERISKRLVEVTTLLNKQ